MKKKMSLCLLACLHLLFLLNSVDSSAAVGCIDDSYHMCKERFYQRLDPSIRASFDVLRNENVKPTDYKAWHSVACSCPCEQYRGYYLKNRTEATGRCVVCRHRGRSDRTSVQDTHRDREEIQQDFALFENMGRN
jgi:hypothetical protein